MAMEVGMHPLGPTPGIKQAYPSRIPRTEHCELTLHIGLFFDGTGNNKDWDNADGCTKGDGKSQYERRCHSNVARLFAAYPYKGADGHHRIYIEGLGTPCPAIGEDTSATLGGPMAEGGDGRINLGLLQVLNTIHMAASPTKQPAFTDDVIKALCRHGPGSLVAQSSPILAAQIGPAAMPPLSDDVVTLAKVNRSTVGGLLMSSLSTNREHALSFYRGQIYAITQFLKNSPKPRPIEIMLDVFGFSRGAAEARVFCSWLSELAPTGTLCGLPLTIRFLGLFDTVASVGIPSAPAMTYNATNGHFAWGQPQWLRIPAQVKNCLHLAAMHENRASFPLDLVRTESGLPGNCQEFAFPGMHSDVGGGYAPGEQGRGTSSGDTDTQDSEKLSQVSLSIMLKAAQAAGAPLNQELAYDKKESYTPFNIHDRVVAAYGNFHRLCGGEQRQMGDWLISYLAWRYQVREKYSQLPWRDRTKGRASDRDDLDGANALLRDDIASLDNTEGVWKGIYSQAWDKLLGITFVRNDAKAVRHMAPEAHDILKRLRAQPATRDAEAVVFGTYAHDSVAGFRPFDQFKIRCHEVLPMHWDLEGYLRYRRFWTGNDKALTLVIEPPKPSPYEEQAAQMQQTVNIKGYGIGDMFPPGGW